MAKRRTTIYWLLLAALLPAVFLLAVSDTYARYDTTTSWNTVISPGEAQPITAKTKIILTQAGSTTTFALSEELAAQTNVTYTFERLLGDGSYEDYISTDLSVSAANGEVTVVLLAATPPPGTYRLRATWTVEETEQPEESTPEETTPEETTPEETEQPEEPEQTATATFFINYSDG